MMVHFDLATDIIKNIYITESSTFPSLAIDRAHAWDTEDDRKLFCGLVTKLYIPPTAPISSVKALLLLIETLKLVRLPFRSCFNG